MTAAISSQAIQSYQTQLGKTEQANQVSAVEAKTKPEDDSVALSGLDKLFEYVAEQFDVRRMIRRDRSALASQLYSLGVIDHQAHRMLASVAANEAGEIDLPQTIGKALAVLPFSQQAVARQLMVITENLAAAKPA